MSRRISPLFGICVALFVSLNTAFANDESNTIRLYNETTKVDFGEAIVGFEGLIAPTDLPGPITFKLKNPFQRKVKLKVVVSPSQVYRAVTPLIEEVTLSKDAEKIIFVNYRMITEQRYGRSKSQIQIRLYEGDNELVVRKVDLNQMSTYTTRYLLFHSKEFRAPPSDQTQNTLLATLPSDAIPETAVVLAPFNAILLYDIDPKSLSAQQQNALNFHALNGGVVCFVEVKAKNIGVKKYFEALKGEVTTWKFPLTSELDVTWKRKSYGRGHFLMTEAAVIKDGFGKLTSTNLKSEYDYEKFLSRFHLSLSAPQPQSYPRFFTENFKFGGNASTIVLMFGFFGTYILVLGPLLGLAMRRASRKRLALSVLVVIAGFIIASPVIAVMIRSTPATVRTFGVLEFNKTGQAILNSEISLVSGGGAHYDCKLAGTRDLAAIVPVTDVRQRYYNREESFSAVSYKNYSSVTGEVEVKALPIESWSQYRFFAFDKPKVAAVDATATEVREGVFNIVLNNKTRFRLRNIIIGLTTGPKGYIQLVLPSLQAGESRTLIADFSKAGNTAGRSFNARKSQLNLPRLFSDGNVRRLLNLPAGADWGRLNLDQRPSLYLAAVVNDPFVKVYGSGIDLYRSYTVWYQPINIEGRRYSLKSDLGLVVGDVEVIQRWGGRQKSNGAKVLGIVPGGPADNAGIKIGNVITSFKQVASNKLSQQGMVNFNVGSAENFRSYVADAKPGQTVELKIKDEDKGTFTVKLKVRALED